MSTFDYDVIVIGGGAAGLTAAKTARGIGKRVALIEENKLGGSCTWTGCVPSKAIIRSADIAWISRHIEQYGLRCCDKPQLDISQVMNHVRSVVKEVAQSYDKDDLEKTGIKVLKGSATFLDAHQLSIDGKLISGKKFIIATGAVPFIPPIKGLDEVPHLTSENIFELNELPKSLIVIGGGPIGCEIASAFNRLGIQVTQLEMADRILLMDEDTLALQLMDVMRREGITFLNGVRATAVKKTDQGLSVTCVDVKTGIDRQVHAQALFIGAGRVPKIQGLGLEKLGVIVGKQGIEVDATLRTAVPHIYACGDVIGHYQFSHMAWYQAVIAARNACIPLFKKKVDYSGVIWVTFTAPELATVGLTEKRAREQYGDAIQVYEFPYSRIDRARTDRELDGMLKVVCDRRGCIIGAHLLGNSAGEVIHELQIARAQGMRLRDLQPIIHAYPTYAEIVWHISKKAYLDWFQNMFIIRMVRKIFTRRS